MLCVLSPALAQEPDRRQAIADAIDAANAQVRLDLARDQVRAHQRTQEQYQKQAEGTAAALAGIRARWTGTKYSSTFEGAYSRALKDPVYRSQALADYDRSPGWDVSPFSFIADNDSVVLVLGGIAIFLAFGWYLTKRGW